MSTVLYTGGCGCIGSECINYLKKKYKYIHFINIDVLTYAGKEKYIEEGPYDNYTFIRGDICDYKFVSWILNKYKPNYIIHMAGETHVDNSFGNSLVFTTTNVYGTHNLLECVRKYINDGNKFKMFLHMSTDEVYGQTHDNEPAKTETSLFSPSNPYAASKAAAEMICMSYIKSFKIPLVIMRCNNAISKNQHEEKLIPKVINCLLQNKKIPIHGEGKSKRTFIHSYDIAEAIDIIMNKGTSGSVYNIGTKMEYTVIEVVKHIMKKMNLDPELYLDYIEFIPDRDFQDYRYSIDSSQLEKLGWIPKITFEESISYVIEKIYKIYKK